MRSILHSDLNNFYASVEILLNPSLRGLPIAVCGSRETRHGIVLAKSEEAKKAGVRTATAIWEAERCCPDLVIVPPHHSEYKKYSEKMRSIYMRYSDLVESFGLDECWIDVTAFSKGQARTVAEEIRAAAKEELGLTVSIGVSFNKVFAKLGSDLKKPDAITEIPYESFRDIVWPLPAGEMLGVGPKTAQKLQRRNIFTIGQLAQCDRQLLEDGFGSIGTTMWRYANGLDDSPVVPAEAGRERKSIGHGQTTSIDMYNNEEVRALVQKLTPRIAKKLQEKQLRACTVEISYRDNTLQSRSNQIKLDMPTQSARTLTETAMKLLAQSYDWSRPLRSFTVTAKDLEREEAPHQLSFFETNPQNEKHEELERAVENIRRRFGEQSIQTAALLDRRKAAADQPSQNADNVSMAAQAETPKLT